MSLESDLKELYERVVLDTIVTEEELNSRNFILQEIYDDRFVYIIRLRRSYNQKITENDIWCKLFPFRIYTEERGNHIPISSDSESLCQLCNDIIEQYGDGAYIDRDVRKWYDEYLVPKIERAIKAREL